MGWFGSENEQGPQQPPGKQPPAPPERTIQPEGHRAPSPGAGTDGTSDRHGAHAGQPAHAGGASDAGGAALIVGHVYRPDRSLLPDAVLTLTTLQGEQVDRTQTAVDGGYQLVPPAGGTYILICAAPDYQPYASQVAVADRNVVRDVALTSTSSTLAGQVRSARGEPLGGVLLTLVDIQGNVAASTSTSADGTYRVAGLTEGTYTLTAAAAGSQPTAETIAVDAAAVVEHDVELGTRTRLGGTVRSARTGRPVEDAIVTVLDGNGGVAATAITGADGLYEFENLPAGTYTLAASGYPPVAASLQVTGADNADHDITLGAGTHD